jgi:uncharacterized protein YuzB (UPF0349 family)
MLKKIFNIVKLSTQLLLVVFVGFAISLGVHISVMESLRFPTPEEIHSLDNISDDLNQKETSAVTRSRQSIIYVLSGYESKDGFAKMSGTYITHNGRFYVVTAAHGIKGPCNKMFVATDSDHVYDCLQYVIIDQHVDYAIIEVEQVAGRTPVKLAEVLPSNREWHQEVSVLNETFYTGYPNGIGPLTFRGSVAGMSEENYLYIHSYAWPGSSGSGVFSYDGNLIGVLIALNVGFAGAGYDVLEDLVIVTPLFMIDWETAYEIMNQPAPAGDTGDTGE